MSRTKTVDAVAELKQTLTHAKPGFKVVVMPDFYLDYILTYPGKLEDLTASFVEVAQRGGGNLLGWRHTVGRGGNASNVVAHSRSLVVKSSRLLRQTNLVKPYSNTFSRTWTFPTSGRPERCPEQCRSRQSIRAGALTSWSATPGPCPSLARRN